MKTIEKKVKKAPLFHPKLWTTLKHYNMNLFAGDFAAGIVVAIIALPLSIALAIASGVAPEQGLFTAIIAGFIISVFGGSRVQIGGPTGAFMIIVYGIVTQFGIDGLILATMMAGLIMILFGLLKFGGIVKFIPFTITTGFTTGIALTIFTSQINDFFGMGIKGMPAEFHLKWLTYAKSLGEINYMTLLIGLISLAIILITPKFLKKIPGTLVAIIVTSLIVYLFDLDVETIGTRFGALSNSLPVPKLPNANLETVKMLFPSAVTIALLGSIESLLSAVVADGMTGGKHRSNTELIAQGMANIASGLFGGIPATGAIARTAANIKNGGKTPVAGITHALTLLLILVLFMPMMGVIPMSTLGAILIVVAYNMSEIHIFGQLLKGPKGDVLVLVITFFLTVFVDLVAAIEFGMILSVFIFMKRMADSTEISELVVDAAEADETKELFWNEEGKVKGAIQVYEINGPLFFGATEAFIEYFSDISRECKILIIRMRHVSVVDATALRAFEVVLDRCDKMHVQVMVTGLSEKPYTTMKNSGIIDRIGENYIYDAMKDAQKYAEEVLTSK